MTTIAFQACEEITIIGFERDCECSHCGRGLKLGVKVEGFGGVFGADCLGKAIGSYKSAGRVWRYSADTLKERAIIAHKGADCMARHNMSAHHFRFTLKNELKSI